MIFNFFSNYFLKFSEPSLCGSPDKNENSTVEVIVKEIPGKTPGSLGTVSSYAEYSCPEGNRVVGDANRTCMASGFWSGDAPTCKCKI